jgi:hypothetical protein
MALLLSTSSNWILSSGLNSWGDGSPVDPPQVNEDYYASWVQQNYIWQPESYPPWWG